MTLDDRITAHPVALATYELASDVRDWQRVGSERAARRVAKAETALAAALDAEDANRTELDRIWRELDTALDDGDRDRQTIAERAWGDLGALLGHLEHRP